MSARVERTNEGLTVTLTGEDVVLLHMAVPALEAWAEKALPVTAGSFHPMIRQVEGWAKKIDNLLDSAPGPG